MLLLFGVFSVQCIFSLVVFVNNEMNTNLCKFFFFMLLLLSWFVYVSMKLLMMLIMIILFAHYDLNNLKFFVVFDFFSYKCFCYCCATKYVCTPMIMTSVQLYLFIDYKFVFFLLFSFISWYCNEFEYLFSYRQFEFYLLF